MIDHVCLMCIHAANDDYVDVSVDVEFLPGVQRACLEISTTSDSVPEQVESFRANIVSTSDARVMITAPESTVIEIIDEDSQ